MEKRLGVLPIQRRGSGSGLRSKENCKIIVVCFINKSKIRTLILMNNKSPLFSILIASYNNGRFLQEAIDSVFAQTYTNWEVVVVDDKSTDNSFEIYDKYKNDSRFRFFYNGKNRGCGYTKRRCAEMANGELCGFLDPDDALKHEALETMVKAHAEHPECSLIYSTCYRYFGDKNAEMPIWDYIGEIPEQSDYLIYQKKLVSHFVSFKKSCYEKCVGINPLLKAAEDKDLYLKLEEVGKLLHLPVPLYYYRVNNPNSVSIGTKEKDMQAYYYSVCSSLDTICRRMGTELYRRNKAEYLILMRAWMRVYYHCNLYRPGVFAKYCFYYLKGNRFSLHAFSHILKIPRNK